MAENRGPLCSTQVGRRWVDPGTNARTRNRPSTPQGIYVCGSPAFLAAKAVMDSLADGAVAKIAFTVDGFAVNPAMYAQVSELVRQGRIAVAYDASLDSCAYYDQNTNRLEVNFTAAVALTKRALVAHETTHAIFDLKRYSTAKVVSSEAAAYIAQCIYACFHATSPDERLYDDDDAKDAVFEKAWVIAGKILARQAPTAADFTALKNAICASPDYPNWNRLSGWNGI